LLAFFQKSAEVVANLVLKVFQSVDERYPLVEPLAWVIVKAPVEELYARGAEAESDVEEILLLNMVKSLAASAPRTAVDAVGRLNVIVFEDAVIVKSLPAVEVARVCVPPVCV